MPDVKRRPLTHLAVAICAASALLCPGCRTSRVTPQRAADIYATTVERAAGDQAMVPRLTVVGHGIDQGAKDLGTVARITFADRSLFESAERVNGALSILAAAADHASRELREAGIAFVEFQAGDGGTRAIVPVSRLLLLARGSLSADALRTTISVIGNCCPPKITPSPGNT